MPSSDVRSSETGAYNAWGKSSRSNFRGFVFRGSYLCVLVGGRENREKLDLVEISRYTVVMKICINFVYFIVSSCMQDISSFQLRDLTKVEGDLLKVVVLAADFLTSFILTMISLSKHIKGSGSDIKDEAFASLGVLFAAGGLYTLFVTCKLCSKKLQSQTASEHRRDMLIVIGGVFYYFGDNLPPLMREYPKELCGDDQGCVKMVQILGIGMLIIATLTYIPLSLKDVLPSKIVNRKGTEPKLAGELIKETTLQQPQREQTAPGEKTRVHIIVLLLAAKMTNLDPVYTAIERAAFKKCNDWVKGAGWTFFAICFIAFWGFSMNRMCNYKKEETQGSMSTQDNTSCSTCTTIVLPFLISAFATLFILADTRLPLACSGIAETNPTLDIIRLVLWLIAFIIGCTLFGWWYCCIYKKRYVQPYSEIRCVHAVIDKFSF